MEYAFGRLAGEFRRSTPQEAYTHVYNRLSAKGCTSVQDVFQISNPLNCMHSVHEAASCSSERGVTARVHTSR